MKILRDQAAVGVLPGPFLPAESDLNNNGYRLEEATLIVGHRFISYDEEWTAFCVECSRKRSGVQPPSDEPEPLPRVWNMPHG